MVEDVSDCIFAGQDFVGVGIWNFNSEFLFNRHDEFNRVETIQSKVIDKMTFFVNFLGYDLTLIRSSTNQKKNQNHCENGSILT